MVDEKKERRGSQRIFFSIEDGIQGTFASPDFHKGSLKASIINLSESGLGLALSKDEQKGIEKGDRVILTQINGIEGLESLANIEAEIKWILDNPSLGFIGCGCEFNDIPESMRDAIRTFVYAWNMENKVGSSEE